MVGRTVLQAFALTQALTYETGQLGKQNEIISVLEWRGFGRRELLSGEMILSEIKPSPVKSASRKLACFPTTNMIDKIHGAA